MNWLSWIFFLHFNSFSVTILFLTISTFFIPSYSLLSHESAALIQFQNSFSIEKYSSGCNFEDSRKNFVNWDVISGNDFCMWNGVSCDEVTGFVVGLNLKCFGLLGIIDSDSSLFALTHLETLILSHNDFQGSEISPEFGKFRSLTLLDLSFSNFSGRVPVELGLLSKLTRLDLSHNHGLTVVMSCLRPIIANLTVLEDLVLSEINMSLVSPNSFVNLSTSLKCLDLVHTGLAGEFPESIFFLQNLIDLRLGKNEKLSGSFPEDNFNSSLEILSLSETKFSVDIPYLARNMKNLNSLYANKCNFLFQFALILKGFSQITTLGLANNNIGGQIPWNLLNLGNLTYLDLTMNNLSGELPIICKNLSMKGLLCDPKTEQLVGPIPWNLKSLLIPHNLINGVIPSWIYSLPFLEQLSLGHNNLTGQINEFVSSRLTVLQLCSNKLVGPVPRSIFEQPHLYWLDLASNDLSDVVTFEDLSKLKSLRHVSLSFNRISVVSSGNSNATLAGTLEILRLSNCNITVFSSSLLGAERLRSLELSNNEISGSVPKWLQNVGKETLFHLNISQNLLTSIDLKFSWRSLQLLDLRGNNLEGRLPIPPLSTILFSVSDNKFVGEIPSAICDLNSMEVVVLSNNDLSGIVPRCLGNFSKALKVLDLRKNNFRGTIPPLSENCSLLTLNLRENNFEGTLPESLLNCKKLEFLDVGNNKLNGSFPPELEYFPELQVLILGYNRFRGPIISDNPIRTSFHKLRILDISNNEFEGVLPENFFDNFDAMKKPNGSNLEYMEKQVHRVYYYRDSVWLVTKGIYMQLSKIQTKLMTIDFSKNSFKGEIPDSFGKLNSLIWLNLSHNMLEGEIPKSFGNLRSLESLDLSSNALAGRIPFELSSLNYLAFLNLSSNKLEGSIPRGPQFETFSEASYRENPELCGFPLIKQCVTSGDTDEDEDEDENMMMTWRMAIAGYGCGLVIGISVGYMAFFGRRFDLWIRTQLVYNRRSVESLIIWH